MRNALTSIVAASLTLGTVIPTTFASTVSNQSQMKKSITVNGTILSSPFGLVSSDTTYMPIYYIGKALEAMGIQQSWDGRAWHLTVPATMPPNAMNVGSGDVGIYVNGHLVKKVNSVIAKDPAGGAHGELTTYLPIWYIQQILSSVGVHNNWNGTTWGATSSAHNTVLKAGSTFGPSQGTTTYDGNIVVAGTGVTMQNVVVNGNIYVDPGDSGTVHLKNMTVNGSIVVLSGASHSIHLDGVTASTLLIDSSSEVHIVSEGNTTIGNTNVAGTDQQSIQLEQISGTFGQVTVSTNHTITLSGSFDNVTVGEGADITIAPGTTISSLTLSGSNSHITISSGSTVTNIIVQNVTGVTLENNGTVESLNDNSSQGGLTVTGTGTVTGSNGGGGAAGGGGTGGTNYTGSEAFAYVQPKDFGVMQFSGVDGYSVGFRLTGTLTDVSKIQVSLVDPSGKTLATNTSTSKLLSDFKDLHDLSTPFNLYGTFHGDGYWQYGEWNGALTDVPAKAVIQVWDKQGNSYTVENSNLSGDASSLKPEAYTGDKAKAYVLPEDFGVMQLSGVDGYNVGLHLTGTLADVQQIQVTLMKGDTTLATNTSTQTLLSTFSTAHDLSTPFNLYGTFSGDQYWNYGSWNGNRSVIPDKAIIEVWDQKGNTYTVENDTLTGDPTSLPPKDYKGTDALKYVQPQDFGVMQFSGVNGYSVGFNLAQTVADTQQIQVTLMKDNTTLATNTSTPTILSTFSAAHEVSTPFNLYGTFSGDEYWNYGKWIGDKSVVPNRAIITVWDQKGNTYTVENDTLTGDPTSLPPKDYKGTDALKYVQPEDFGVMQFSGVNGYSVGLNLTGTAADVQEIEVTLEDASGKTLATNTSTPKLLSDFSSAHELSTPFNLYGYFKGDQYWNYGDWKGSNTDVPAKAIITVMDKEGNSYTVATSGPSGDLLPPKDYTGDAALAYVQPQDFGAMDFSGVNGYSVGFNLTKTAADAYKIEVTLMDGTKTLATNCSTSTLLTTYAGNHELSTPFDTQHSYHDDYWNYGAWSGDPNEVPTEAVIKVYDLEGNTYTVTKNYLS